MLSCGFLSAFLTFLIHVSSAYLFTYYKCRTLLDILYSIATLYKIIYKRNIKLIKHFNSLFRIFFSKVSGNYFVFFFFQTFTKYYQTSTRKPFKFYIMYHSFNVYALRWYRFVTIYTYLGISITAFPDIARFNDANYLT